MKGRTLKQWCNEHISSDVEYEGDDEEQYQLYLTFAEHYLDVFLNHIPQSLERIVSEYDNMSAVQYAATQGYDHFINALSTPSTDPFNQSMSGTTPLHLSASQGHRHTLEALLKRGADATQVNTDGKLPLHCALFVPGISDGHLIENKEIIFNDLIARAPQTMTKRDGSGDSVAHLMAKNGFYRLLSDLAVRHKPAIFYKNNHSRYPIHTAILNGELDIARLLFKIDGVASLVAEEGRIPLHFAAQYGSAEMVQLCCEFTPDINARDKTGKTALILAAESMNISAIKTLIKQNGGVTSAEYQGQPALDYILTCVKRTKNEKLSSWITDNSNDANQAINPLRS